MNFLFSGWGFNYRGNLFINTDFFSNVSNYEWFVSFGIMRLVLSYWRMDLLGF